MQWRSFVFLLGLVIAYVCTKWAKHHLHLHPFFRDHFTDLLFIPMQLTLALIVLRLLRREDSIRIPAWQIVGIVCSMIALFEWYLPMYGTRKQLYTADLTDALMYILGGTAFFYVQRRLNGCCPN